ncbi:hypothetical protein PVL29_004031 [Vitis rotundifolia]|uniref:Uncharacterized protein n=1 Tax=Vitis rotundifolia TaxID=103349 RepID=A0AA39A7T1_VITRO|nr:hypothetical protein PVL29_004031 [Vitis rotundifolia]
MQRLLMQITTADLDFRENAHTIKSERKNLICWSIVLVFSLILFFITQVTFAYKRKVEELRSQELDEEETNNKLGLLKESYSILSSPKERRLYDWSLTRSEKPDRYAWPFEVEKAITPTEEPPAQEPEDVRPTILVGYFLFAWLILSFTLSIALNR